MLGYYIQKETSILNHCFDLAAITYHSPVRQHIFHMLLIHRPNSLWVKIPKPFSNPLPTGIHPALTIQPRLLHILIASFGCPAKHPSQKRIAGWLPDFVQDTRGERCSLSISSRILHERDSP